MSKRSAWARSTRWNYCSPSPARPLWYWLLRQNSPLPHNLRRSMKRLPLEVSQPAAAVLLRSSTRVLRAWCAPRHSRPTRPTSQASVSYSLVGARRLPNCARSARCVSTTRRHLSPISQGDVWQACSSVVEKRTDSARADGTATPTQ